MKRFTLFKASEDIYPMISDVCKMLIGNRIEISSYKECLLVIHNDCNVLDIKNAFKSLEEDLNEVIVGYTSYLTLDINDELELIYPLFLDKNFGFYDFKSLLLSLKGYKSHELLHFIIDGSGVDENVIEKMAMANLNVSKASSMLYLHRNSLNYKIDRLILEKDFDLRNFMDLYILYSLM